MCYLLSPHREENLLDTPESENMRQSSSFKYLKRCKIISTGNVSIFRPTHQPIETPLMQTKMFHQLGNS